MPKHYFMEMSMHLQMKRKKKIICFALQILHVINLHGYIQRKIRPSEKNLREKAKVKAKEKVALHTMKFIVAIRMPVQYTKTK